MNALIRAIHLAVKEHGGLRPAARALGTDPSNLHKLLRGVNNCPGKELLEKLGIVRVVTIEYFDKKFIQQCEHQEARKAGCDCDCHRPGVTMMHAIPCCEYVRTE